MHRRLLGLAAIAVSALMLAGCMSGDESSGLNAINADRGANGQAALFEHGALITKAQEWAFALAQNSGGRCSMATLAHSSLSNGAPDGWQRLGENVGCRVAPGDVASSVGPLETGFMNSPGHRANILEGTFNAGGVGFASVPSADLPGYLVVYETQEFAAI